MKLELSQTKKSYTFVQIPISFNEKICSDIFAFKNNKTVNDTLAHKRYAKFSTEIMTKYPDSLSQPLGVFLSILKQKGDENYKKFLNSSGDKSYINFKIAGSEYINDKGIYAYYINQELKYIGRCKDSMKKRINNGYGKITPKNCYLDGQSTNCHLNSLIAKANPKVTLWFHKMECDIDIENTEKLFIKELNPPWNRTSR